MNRIIRCYWSGVVNLNIKNDIVIGGFFSIYIFVKLYELYIILLVNEYLLDIYCV